MTDVDQVLSLPIGPNDANAQTIGGFLSTLLRTLWFEGEGFDSKRPFGNSDWGDVVIDALEAADMDDGDLVEAIESLSRDVDPVGLLVDDIRAAGTQNSLTIAAALIEKGWHK